MTKQRQAGSSAEALWQTVRAIGRQKLGEECSDEAARAEGIAECALLFGISKGVMRNIMDPDQPEQLSIERAGLIARHFGVDVLARWLAGEASGLFVPLPHPSGDIEKLTASGVRQVGETAARIIEALAAGSAEGAALSKEEAIAVRRDAGQVADTFGQITALVDRIVQAANRAARKAGQ